MTAPPRKSRPAANGAALPELVGLDTDRIPRSGNNPQTLDRVSLPWRTLDVDTERLLRDGDTFGRYRSGSELAMSLAVRFRNHGRSADEYLDAMTTPENTASAWYRNLRDGRRCANRKTARGKSKAETELHRCWTKAGRLPAPRDLDPADVYERGEAARAVVTAKIGARRKMTRLIVLDVLIGYGMRHSTAYVMAAERQVATDAGVHRNTVCAALHDLAAIGVLTRVNASTDAAVYTLNRVHPTCASSASLTGVRTTGTTRVQSERGSGCVS